MFFQPEKIEFLVSFHFQPKTDDLYVKEPMELHKYILQTANLCPTFHKSILRPQK